MESVLYLFYTASRYTRSDVLLYHIESAVAMYPRETTQVMFYVRSVRGEKAPFRFYLKWISFIFGKTFTKKDYETIVNHSTWKDLLESFLGTANEDSMLEFYAERLMLDIDNFNSTNWNQNFNQISHAAKWFPSEKNKKRKSRNIGARIIHLLNTKYAPSSCTVKTNKDLRTKVLTVLKKYLASYNLPPEVKPNLNIPACAPPDINDYNARTQMQFILEQQPLKPVLSFDNQAAL